MQPNAEILSTAATSSKTVRLIKVGDEKFVMTIRTATEDDAEQISALRTEHERQRGRFDSAEELGWLSPSTILASLSRDAKLHQLVAVLSAIGTDAVDETSLTGSQGAGSSAGLDLQRLDPFKTEEDVVGWLEYKSRSEDINRYSFSRPAYPQVPLTAHGHPLKETIEDCLLSQVEERAFYPHRSNGLAVTLDSANQSSINLFMRNGYKILSEMKVESGGRRWCTDVLLEKALSKGRSATARNLPFTLTERQTTRP